MLDRISAEELVANRLAVMSPADDCWLVVSEKIIERHFGWIFFYNSERFLTTGKTMYRLAGNGPVFVNKITGSVEFFGSRPPLQVILEKYETGLK
jgi:Immunity protein 35